MIPSGYSKNVLSGALPGGEIWQCGIWCSEAPSTAAATTTQAQAFAADVASAFSGGSGLMGSLWAAGTTCDRVTTYSYLSDSGKATYVGEGDLTLHGTNTQNMPDQIAAVATLLTGLSGRSYRGRTYWPVTALPSGAALSQDLCDALAGFWHDVIVAWNGHLAGGAACCVLSQKLGAAHPISAIRVNGKLDTQRRRTNKLGPGNTSTVDI